MSTVARRDWSDWSDRVYGPDDQEWKALNKRYWRSRWTLFSRCLICRAGYQRGLTLNHLAYWPTKIRTGWVPLLFLVPLCQRCHRWETWATRRLRRVGLRYGAHVLATFGSYLVTRSVIVGLLWYLLILWPGVPSPAALWASF